MNKVEKMISKEIKNEKEELPLVLYKKDEVAQLSPPKMIKIRWFFMPVEVPAQREELIEFLEKVRERIGKFCDFEAKQIRISADTLEKEGEYQGLIIYAQLGGEEMFSPARIPEPPIKLELTTSSV